MGGAIGNSMNSTHAMQNYAAQNGHSLTVFALVSNDSSRPLDGLPDSGTIYEDWGESDADRDAHI